MPFSSISIKGQVTLPARLRKKIGLKPGDRVSIESSEDAIVIRRVRDFFEFEGAVGKALPPEEERERMMRGVAERTLKGGR